MTDHTLISDGVLPHSNADSEFEPMRDAASHFESDPFFFRDKGFRELDVASYRRCKLQRYAIDIVIAFEIQPLVESHWSSAKVDALSW